MNSDTEAALAHNIAVSLSQFKKIDWRPEICREIKKSEFMLLGTIAHNTKPESKGIKVSELSALMEITPAAVTHMINSLEQGGYIERLADPSDRRIVLIKLTEKGHSIGAEMKKEFLSLFKRLVNYLGEDDSKELARILELCSNFLKERKKDSPNACSDKGLC